MNKLRELISYARGFVAHRRIKFNQLFFLGVLIFLAHPRNQFFFVIGFFIGLCGALLRIWAKGTLLRNTPELITVGPYRLVRHPMYVGTMLEFAGICIACFSVFKIFGWVVFLLVVTGYFIFVYKEAMLLEEDEQNEKHGLLWENYAARTPAIFPTLKDLKSLRWFDLKSFQFRRFEISKEWNNFLMFIGVCALLWFKLVYRL